MSTPKDPEFIWKAIKVVCKPYKEQIYNNKDVHYLHFTYVFGVEMMDFLYCWYINSLIFMLYEEFIVP